MDALNLVLKKVKRSEKRIYNQMQKYMHTKEIFVPVYISAHERVNQSLMVQKPHDS